MTTSEANDDKAAMNLQINAQTDAQMDAQAATVYLALGTNIGDREANLREAVERINTLGLVVTHQSSIYETEPVGFADQAWFLNQVIEAQMPRNLTFESNAPDVIAGEGESDAGVKIALPDQLVLLLAALLKIESDMGRHRTIANGPRVIDIDVLLCGEIAGVFGGGQGSQTFDSQASQHLDASALPELILPHPRMHLRRFVLEPLCEIAPAIIHPTLHKTCGELLATLDDASTVRLYSSAL